MPRLDPVDKLLLNRIQSNFPITSRPYQSIADELGLTENEVIERIGALKSTGVIRRIGANFVPAKVGYVSTLCAAKVPDELLDKFTETVNRYNGVTHNYLREHDVMNVWFTFIAQSRKEIDQHLDEISRETGITGILNMPATHVYKIKAQFEL